MLNLKTLSTETAFVVHSGFNDPEETKAWFRKKVQKAGIGWVIDGISAEWIHENARNFPNISFGGVKNILSKATHEVVDMSVKMIPMNPQQMVDDYPEDRIIALCRKLPVERITLGMLTKRGGAQKTHNILKAEGKIICTGNDLTAIGGVEQMFETATAVGLDCTKEQVLIIGGKGAIASLAAYLVVKTLKDLTSNSLKVLVAGRPATNKNSGSDLSKLINFVGRDSLEQVTPEEGLQKARLIISATGEAGGLSINPQCVKQGSLVLDLARPRDWGKQFENRKDVLVIEGGLYRYFGNDIIDTFKSGLSNGLHYACESQGVGLALEGNRDLFTIGQEPHPDKALAIAAAVKKHGIERSELRSYGQSVDTEQLQGFSEYI